MIGLKSSIYIGIIGSGFLVTKILGVSIAFSPYMLFMALFVGWFGWTKILGIHAFFFMLNESQVASSVIPLLGKYWFLLYTAYFFITFIQAFSLHIGLKRYTALFRMIHL